VGGFEVADIFKVRCHKRKFLSKITTIKGGLSERGGNEGKKKKLTGLGRRSVFPKQFRSSQLPSQSIEFLGGGKILAGSLLTLGWLGGGPDPFQVRRPRNERGGWVGSYLGKPNCPSNEDPPI